MSPQFLRDGASSSDWCHHSVAGGNGVLAMSQEKHFGGHAREDVV